MDEKTRQDVIKKLRCKVFGLRGIADLMKHINIIDDGVVDIGSLGDAIGELTEGMLDMIDTLEERGESE